MPTERGSPVIAVDSTHTCSDSTVLQFLEVPISVGLVQCFTHFRVYESDLAKSKGSWQVYVLRNLRALTVPIDLGLNGIGLTIRVTQLKKNCTMVLFLAKNIS